MASEKFMRSVPLRANLYALTRRSNNVSARLHRCIRCTGTNAKRPVTRSIIQMYNCVSSSFPSFPLEHFLRCITPCLLENSFRTGSATLSGYMQMTGNWWRMFRVIRSNTFDKTIFISISFLDIADYPLVCFGKRHQQRSNSLTCWRLSRTVLRSMFSIGSPLCEMKNTPICQKIVEPVVNLSLKRYLRN